MTTDTPKTSTAHHKPSAPDPDPPQPGAPHPPSNLDTPAASPCVHLAPGTPRLTHPNLLDAMLAEFSTPSSILTISGYSKPLAQRLLTATRNASCERCRNPYGTPLYFSTDDEATHDTYFLCFHCGHCTRIA